MLRIGAADITKLKTNGFYTVASVHGATRKTLLKIRGFSEVKVEKIKDAINKCLPSASGFITAMELSHQRKRVVRISTGSKQFDAILGGGFQSMSISEVFGEFRCGKTQLSHTMSVVAQLPKEMGGADGKVAYIDTEGTFRPERIAQIAERFGVDADSARENIAYARALNSEHQLELLNVLSKEFTGGEYRLLIIDSIMNCFRVDYCGRGELADRQQKLNQFLMKLAHMAEAGYTVLPLRLPPAESKRAKPATHYLYLRPHEPRIPDADTPRSLFIVNVPIDTTELHLRHLFGSQLAAGRVERVHFEAVPTKKKGGMTTAHSMVANVSKSKKRKRVTADELQNQLDDVSLPSTWDSELQKSGAHAVVVFVDKPSMEASVKAAKKAGKKKDGEIVWGEGIEDRLPQLGLQRYLDHEKARYPPRAELLRTVNDFMTVFEAVAEARRKEQALRAQEPDEDGFITVTSGPKLTSVAHEDEARDLIEKQKKKSQGLEDFYRFQSREKRKERQNELLKKFDEDKKKLEEIKKRKGKIRAGSTKETTVINHIDKTILIINRRHAKKFSSAFDDQAQQESERGYESFKEVAKDIEGLVDILWVTGTREDADSGAPLPGFESRRNVVSMTEKVRIKSIAETCRVAVVEAREQVDGPDDEDEDGLSDDDDDMDDVFGTDDYPSPGRWEMETARVYEKTIQLLGDELGKAGEFCDTNLAPGDTCQAEPSE
ncbi:hypothetical protein APSETT445_004335 [Aspergillus pseudonomiae]